MSFASEVKKELLNIEDLEECCQKALLYGILQASSEIVIGNGGYRLIVKSTILNTLKIIKPLLKKYFDSEITLGYKEESSLKKRKIYQVEISDAEKIVREFNLMPFVHLSRSDDVIARACCKSAFLRGLFIAKGSINDPRKNCYHFEISCQKENVLRLAKRIFSLKDIDCKITERRNQYVLYIKKSEMISDALAFVGADSGVFYFEDQRIVRDVSNMANRIANCDIANEVRCAQNCDKQLEAIKYLRDNGFFEKLSLRLQTMAIMREEYSESSLDELSMYSENIFGKKLSKSGISHCLKDLMNFYEAVSNGRQNLTTSNKVK